MGPATKSRRVLKNMILEGVNVFRINFSHADYNVVKENISLVRELSEELQTQYCYFSGSTRAKITCWINGG